MNTKTPRGGSSGTLNSSSRKRHASPGRSRWPLLLMLWLAGLAVLQSGCSTGISLSNTVGSGPNPGQITVPPPPITVTITLNSASLTPGGTLQLSAVVQGTTNTTVVWAVNGIPGGNSTVGTIGSSGTYTAPAVPPVPNTVTITATSVQDSTKFASTTVVITQPATTVVVSVSPASSTVQTGAMVAFTALVTGTTNTTVTWSVNGIPGGNATLGTISGLGIYAAPAGVPTPATLSIQATSTADPTAAGFANLTVQQSVAVAVNPAAPQLQTSTQQQFAATVSGTPTQTVSWAVNGVAGGNAILGTIDTTGLYTAPGALPTGNMVTVSATSAVDPTAMGFATVSMILSPGVVVTISPTMGQLNINQTQQYTATVSGLFQGVPPSPIVAWHVNSLPGGNPTIGTIDAAGLYTAPATVPFPSILTITAFSTTDATAQASAMLQIIAPTLVTVTTAPAAASVQVGNLQQFTASVAGTPTQTVTWSVNGIAGGNAVVGTIDAAGLYTAPAGLPAPATVLVTAASTVDPMATGSSMATINAAPVPITVAVSPMTASVRVLNQLQFMAAVSGTATQTVTWSLSGAGCAGAACGTIDVTGLYTAPGTVPAPATVTVTATSTVAPASMGTSTVTLLPATSITINPTGVTAQTGTGVQFFVTVTGVANTAVTYAVNNIAGGNSTVGTISATGLYLAPATVPTPNPVSITATSVADPTLVATAMVTVAAPVMVSVAPPTAMLNLGQQQQFTETVTGSANTAVNWSVNGVAGGNATVGTIDNTGLYTAPASLLITQSFTITATSVVNPSAIGNAIATVAVPIAVTVSPVAINVVAGQMQPFSATVSGTANTAVTWTLSGAGCAGATCGSITAAGLYTAPAAPPVPSTVTVTATSVADMTKSGTATVTVQPVVAVSVAPPTATLLTGGMQMFMATVTGSANTTVTWLVNGVVGGNATVGMIDAAGNYTAPAAVPTPNTVTVTAQSNADPTKTASATVTINAPVAVMVAPGGVTLTLGQMQQFVATVTGTMNTAVTWTLTQAAVPCAPGCGMIDAMGLYTAPAVLPAMTNVTVTATSVADMTKMASATVTISSTVTVSVSPSSATLVVGTAQPFMATVTGSPDTTVTWLVNGVVGGNATVGMIDVAGNYTAPAVVPMPNMVMVTAQSNADPTKTASATVTINLPVAVTLAPAAASVPAGQTQSFTATVTGTANTAVNFTLSGAGCAGATCGSITAGGLYTAPGVPPAPPDVTVTATSVADMTKNDTATVTVQPVVAVSVAPPTATLLTGGMQMFMATVTGSANTTVTWLVNGVVGGNATVGMIDAAGNYTAPASVPTPNSVTVTARSNADMTKTASATVTINAPVAVMVTPAGVSLTLGQTQQFTATVTGTMNTAVTWTLTQGAVPCAPGCGTISAAGLYTAPAVLPAMANVTVTATSVADMTKMGSATVTIFSAVTVSVSPSSVALVVGTPQLFTATVTGSPDTTVTWLVNGVVGGNATTGTINAAGNYTAPAVVPMPNTVTVTARSNADMTKTASATVTVNPPVAVTLAPATASVPAGQTQSFTATVTGTANTAVNFTLSGAGCSGATCGTITSGGLYTAPAVPPAPPDVTVTATSQADPTKNDTSTITVTASVAVSISPTSAFLNTVQTQQFTATVTGSMNTTVTWTVNGVAGGNATVGTVSATGFYTAPAATPTPATVTVTATSNADNTKSASAMVTITSPAVGVFVTVFPQGVNLPHGRTQQFRAHVIRSNNPSVTWAVNGIAGGNATVGTIDATGLYTPPTSPAALPMAIMVRATSVADPTASMTANATVVARVTVSPASGKLNPNQTLQFTATVTGTANTAVTWAVNGVVGGDINVGSISAAGLYSTPASLPTSGMLTISATSNADGTVPGVATLGLSARVTEISPRNALVLPGARVLFQTGTAIFPQTVTGLPLADWSVNGTIGGNATVGTITPAGVYTAPATLGNLTIGVASTVDPARTDQTQLTVASPTGLSPIVGLISPLVKIRPYDPIAATMGVVIQTIEAVRNQYASTQVVVQARQEELTGVNVSVTQFVDGMGNSIPAANATVYLEKYINASYVSRAQGDIGEWPDALIPKVDPFVGETRNAFPFALNRISPAYKRFPRVGGETVNTGMGAGRVMSSGSFTNTVFRHYVVEVTQAGTASTARYRWSDNGGVTFNQSNVLATTAAAGLNDGVMVAFQNGGVAGVNDFNVGDTFWIFAGPLRNQPVWIDVFIPASTPAGTYNGQVAVVRAGKANVNLTLNIVVKAFTLPVTATVPSYVGMNWNDLVGAHFLTAGGPQTLSLGHQYGKACLINRISCDTASAFPPTFTFNADGTVASSSYAAYDQATAPLANGTITPHGEQLTSMRYPQAGVNDTQTFYAAQNMESFYNSRGWYPRVFDFSGDDPGTPAEVLAAMDRSSLIRSASPNTRTLVTADISTQNYNLAGYVNRWSPNWASLDRKEFLDGPNTASRGFYDRRLMSGDELWWYESCRSHGCATGTSPRHDNIVTFTFDTSLLMNREWGLLAASPYRVNGFLYQNSVLAYSRFFNMTAPRIDVWESVYYLGGNGDGTLFYPGRPSDIGGSTHIPVESLRLKMIREAMVQQEVASFLASRGDLPFLQNQIFNGLHYNIYTYNPGPNSNINVTNALTTQAASPPQPPPISVPAVGQCFIDPETGNRVCTVTGPSLCTSSGKHNYSYWPIWNQTGTHFIVECNGWTGGGGITAALLIRDSDLAVVGNALQGAPGGLQTLKLQWSRTNPNIVYGYRGTEVHSWNPFTQTGGLIKNFGTLSFLGKQVQRADLAYVSFDDRYFLMEFYNAGLQFSLGVYDRVTDITSFLDTAFFTFYDESVFTKDGGVWVIGDVAGVTHSFRYTRDFVSRVRVSDHGHHGHGLLPNGVAVAVKETARQCPSGTPAGTPSGTGWAPGASIMDESIDSSANPVANPFPSELRRVGCGVKGRHHFGHFSWNNTHTDRFFVSSNSYDNFVTEDPLQHAILRFKLLFSGTGQLNGDTVEVIVRHRSDDNVGYFALPRVACNPQGSRCLFSSSMTVNTTNTNPATHLYVVDIPNP